MTIQELYRQIDTHIAPFALAEEWDNSGLLVGDPGREVTAALVCLDITPGAIDEALARGANVLVSHHPVIFHPLKAVLAGGVVHRLIRADLGAVCCHTSLDIAPGGVNDCLARALGLLDCGPFEPLARDPGHSLGRVGALPEPLPPEAFARHVAESLGAEGNIRFVPGTRPVSRVAVCGGAGGSLAGLAVSRGADALVTSELRHDVLIDCAAGGITAVDAGHFETERVVLPSLAQSLARLCPGTAILVSRQSGPALRA